MLIDVPGGFHRIYSHQLATWNEVRAGRSVALVSPTAWGKTLAYNLPVLQALLEDPDARAMFLFPTKALSQDQQSELNEVVLGGDIPVKVFTHDGHTLGSIRISARDEGRSSSPIPTCCTRESCPTIQGGSRRSLI
jgi:DEAD/DEAH box helicase domain-containing protein